MARTKGTTNKEKPALPQPLTLPTEERVKMLAAIIVDMLIEEQGREAV